MTKTLNRRATTQFLLAAKSAEINSLSNLAGTCQLVTSTSNLIHELQRERGLTNVFLASKGERLQQSRADQMQLSQLAEQQMGTLLENNYLGKRGQNTSTRLLSAVAFVLQGLDELAVFRDQTSALATDAQTATQVFGRLIAGLLSIVFEAADSAGDPDVSRALIALLNFMQGKEYAGQERAWAAIGFTDGIFSSALNQRLDDLQAAQQRAFGIFSEYAQTDQHTEWQAIEKSDAFTELKRLRSIIDQLAPEQSISPAISEIWYDVATARINQMHTIERHLSDQLLDISRRQIERAQQQYSEQKNRLESLPQDDDSARPLSMLLDMDAPIGPGSMLQPFADAPGNLKQTVYDLLREQSAHLSRAQRELNLARQALAEQKLIERAKRLLMENLGLTEEVAHRKIQQRAMASNLRIAEVCEILIAAAKKASLSATPPYIAPT